MFFKDSHFSIFLNFDLHFHLFFTKKPPICDPEAPKWGHVGVPRAFLGVSWAPFLPLWALLGTLGHPLGALQKPPGTVLLNLGASRALPGLFFIDFQWFSIKKLKIFNVKITDFHTDLPSTYHSYFLYFQSLQSLFPSNHPIIQSSKHPMGPGGMRGAFE